MTPNWVLRDSALSTNEFLVYQALLSRADARREAWPSMRLLASDSRLSEATVKRTLPLLESRGLITKTVRPRGDGTNMSNLYLVVVLPNSRPIEGSRYAFLLRPKATQTTRREREGVTVNPPGNQGDPAEGVTVTVEEDPLEEDTREEDKRFELPSELERAYLRDAPEQVATEAQVSYLRDLFIQHHRQIPRQNIEDEIRALNPIEASRLITTYLRAIEGRGGMYDGPEEGTPEYDALSPTGQLWADEGLLPPREWAAPTPARETEPSPFEDVFSTLFTNKQIDW